jgi:hypothetical protein
MEVAQCPEGLREVVHRVQGVVVVVALYLPAGG